MASLRQNMGVLLRLAARRVRSSDSPILLTARALSTHSNQPRQHPWSTGADSTARKGSRSLVALAASAALGLVGSAAVAHASQAPAPAPAADATAEAAPLPEYTAAEVAAHRTPADRVWVTYRGGVYDITDFIAQHPGGAQKIMLAAGGSIEPFWGMYQQHQKGEIRDLLETYRIGTLQGGAPPAKFEDPFRNEPARHPALIMRSDKPCNAETPPELLVASLVTSPDVFYVRNHLPVPTLDESTFVVTIDGDGLRSLELSVPELKRRFKKYSVAATVECGGNRRSDMKRLTGPGGHEIRGLDWDAGAIGTAVWAGARLRDVLQAAGLDESDPAIRHIQFYGADVDESGEHYGASIPLRKALDAAGDVLLAYEMNGGPIPRDHGGPLRAVVPGVVGARSVKWLTQVVASPQECQGHFQQRDYKAFSPGADYSNLDWSSAPAIQEMPVVSAVCEPVAGGEVSKWAGEVTAKGYAWSGGGRDIIRVDVTLDGGKTWSVAELSKLPQSTPGRAWAWTHWEATLPLPEGYTGPLQIACKATDEAYNTQPETAASVWNARGMVNNSWHTVEVNVTE